METSQSGIDMIKGFESFSGKIYQDEAGNETIGYGHKLMKEEKDTGKYKGGISKKDAEDLLRQDLKQAENAVNKDVKVPLTRINSTRLSPSFLTWVRERSTGAHFSRSSTMATTTPFLRSWPGGTRQEARSAAASLPVVRKRQSSGPSRFRKRTTPRRKKGRSSQASHQGRQEGEAELAQG